jgi:hypothetical protein
MFCIIGEKIIFQAGLSVQNKIYKKAEKNNIACGPAQLKKLPLRRKLKLPQAFVFLE